MILTTHFLDEADVLADHVVVITHGHLKCQGSAVDLKNQFGGGYRVHLRNTNSGPEMGFPIRRLLSETVYETPTSEAAAALISRLEKSGHSDILVNGPSIEDVFLKVAEEVNVAQEGDSSEQANFERDAELSLGTDTPFSRQVLVLFRKRATILFRNWWPYLLVLAMPIAVTPNLKVFLDYYTIPSCATDLAADVHFGQPFNFESGSFPLSMPVGPPGINGSLFNVVSKFPIGKGIDLGNYTGRFIFKESLSEFQKYISSNYTSVSPGGLYMDSNTSSPTYAYVSDHGPFFGMLVQNLWTQVRSGIPIAGTFVFFNSLISVSPALVMIKT